jgi:hypothetical protein
VEIGAVIRDGELEITHAQEEGVLATKRSARNGYRA